MIRAGIIGMGLRGKIYADTFEQSPKASVVAVADINERNLKESQKQYNVSIYTNYEEMYTKENLDIVIVATPDYLHKDPVIKAAEKGINILVEKPFSTNVDEAIKMQEAIQQNNVKCMVGFENRWNSPFIAVKKSIENNDLGSINSINSKLNDSIYVPTEMLSWSSNSTPGWFLLSHTIDLACWFKNVSPVKIYAVGTRKKLIEMGIDTYDSIQATITFADDTHATFTSSWVLPNNMPLLFDFKYEVIGENGSLNVDLHDQMVKKVTTNYEHVPTLGLPIDGRKTEAPSQMLLSFIDNVANDTGNTSNEEEGLLNTKIITALHKSIKSGIPEYI